MYKKNKSKIFNNNQCIRLKFTNKNFGCDKNSFNLLWFFKVKYQNNINLKEVTRVFKIIFIESTYKLFFDKLIY